MDQRSQDSKDLKIISKISIIISNTDNVFDTRKLFLEILITFCEFIAIISFMTDHLAVSYFILIQLFLGILWNCISQFHKLIQFGAACYILLRNNDLINFDINEFTIAMGVRGAYDEYNSLLKHNVHMCYIGLLYQRIE